MKKRILALGIFTMHLTIAGYDQEAGKSQGGTNDQIGTLNMMTNQSRLDALKSITTGKVYDLSVEYL